MRNIYLLFFGLVILTSCRKEIGLTPSGASESRLNSSKQDNGTLGGQDPNLFYDIFSDGAGDIWFHDLYSFVYRIRVGSNTIVPYGYSCLPIRVSHLAKYQGVFYAQTSWSSTYGIGARGPFQSIYDLCGTKKSYFTSGQYVNGVHSDYHGKIYVALYTGPEWLPTSEETAGPVLVVNPSQNTFSILNYVYPAKDIACDANGNIVTVSISDGSVHFWGMSLPYNSHVKLGTISAERVCVDKVTGQVYALLSTTRYPMEYNWGTGAWQNLPRPIKGEDICAYDDNVYIVENGVVYKATLKLPYSGYFNQVYP